MNKHFLRYRGLRYSRWKHLVMILIAILAIGLLPWSAINPFFASAAGVDSMISTNVGNKTHQLHQSSYVESVLLPGYLSGALSSNPIRLPFALQPDDDSLDMLQVGNVDLAVTKSVTPAVPAEGDIVTYTIGLTNNGPDSATGVVLTDTLPVDLTYSTSSATQGSYDSASGAWTVGDLALNGVATLTLITTVNSGTLGKTIVNSIDGLASNEQDSNPANDTASASIRVKSMRLIGRVTVQDSSPAVPVSEATVTVTQGGTSTSAVTSASGYYTITETTQNSLVAGAATLSASKSGYQSASRTVTLVDDQDNTGTDFDFALGTTDLSITKTDGRTTVSPGQTYTYTITVKNLGSITAESYVITDTLSPYLTYIDDDSGIEPVKSGDTYIWEVDDDLLKLEENSFEVEVKVDSSLPSASTQIVNKVNVATSSPEANKTNNEATDTNNGTGTHNVSITVSVSPSSVRTGQNATYTIKVSNSGSAAVTDVEMTDTFSQYLDIVSASTNKGSRDINESSRRVTASIGTLNAGQTATITVVAKVNNVARANLTVSNSASVTYKFGGSSFTKSSSSASFQIVFSSTLPGTGGIELPTKSAETPGLQGYLVALISAILLAMVGFVALWMGVRAKASQSNWASFTLRFSLMFFVSAVFFGLAAWGLYALTGNPSASGLMARVKPEWVLKATPVMPEDPPWVWSPIEGEPEVLPDFPIPEPTDVAPDSNGNSPDTSPVTRIVVPILGIDTVVKYVPYDGFTWLIGGLQHEVAWMGDTSWPGLGGNTGLAGHVSLRNGRDGPFRYLDSLQPNDEIMLYTEENLYIYKVNARSVVSDSDMSVIQPTENPRLTLITCINFDRENGVYRDRLIVQADLLSVTSLAKTIRGN